MNLSRDELRTLVALKEWKGSMWDTDATDEIKSIKSKIRRQLENGQTTCAYCGLKLNGTSKGEIEHIAPKASFRYPQFTFTLLNMVLACHFCNGFDKKGTNDTISKTHKLYRKCEFSIVHPYFDNPDDHFEWDDKNTTILISVKNNSERALNTLKIFKLDTTVMNELRAQQVRFDELKRQYQLTSNDEDLIRGAIN